MTATVRSSLPDAYLELIDRHPELHDEPHHPEHDDCWLCARARRALGYIRARDRFGPCGVDVVSRVVPPPTEKPRQDTLPTDAEIGAAEAADAIRRRAFPELEGVSCE